MIMIRYEFADESVTRESLHPDDIYRQEQKLACEYVKDLDKSPTAGACPVCGAPLNETLFEKWGYSYFPFCSA